MSVLLGLSISLGGAQETEIVAFEALGSHTWEVPSGVDEVDVLVVGGGGGGGQGGGAAAAGGAGGAGGLIYRENYGVSSENSVAINVGRGGNGKSDAQGENGDDSEFHNLVAKGGGGGGTTSGGVGADGGSGGGGGGQEGVGGSALQPDSTSGGYGSDGGDGNPNELGGSGDDAGGGGGGAGQAGDPGENDAKGGDGGDGLYYGDVFGDGYGENGYFAGGGGGGQTGYYGGHAAGSGGLGGGGKGEYYNNGDAEDGLPNTGGGGGGGANTKGADGGSGIVLVKYDAGPSICDRRGTSNECVSNSSHSVSGQSFNISSVFRAEEPSFFSALSGMATIKVDNSSFLSGVWEGSFNISTPRSQRNVLKPGADFRPVNGRIIID